MIMMMMFGERKKPFRAGGSLGRSKKRSTNDLGLMVGKRRH
jgi:hypothetical protein